MAKFLIRRLIFAIPVLFGISLVTFSLARAIPGDPCRAVLGERATDEICDAFFIRNGLDKPVYTQFAYWMLGNDRVKVDEQTWHQVRVGDNVGWFSQQQARYNADEGTIQLNGTRQNLLEEPNSDAETVSRVFATNEIEYVESQVVDVYGEKKGVLRGDLGSSFRFQRPVSQILSERLPVTIELTLNAIIFAVLVGVPLGIISAYKHNSAIDVGTMVGANIGVSMPVFWLGLMLSYLFGVILKDTIFALPPSGRLAPGLNPEPFYLVWGLVDSADDANNFLVFMSRFNIFNAIATGNIELLVDAIRHLILPAVAVGTIPLSIIARMTRSSLLEVLNQDYVRTARAKGLSETSVVMKHAVRNALLPVVTIIGLNFGFLISGAVLTETIFSLTGIGKTLFDGITARDYTLIQGVTLVTAFAFVFINMFVDMLYGYLDPRIRLG